jgi:hypothetical protein
MDCEFPRVRFRRIECGGILIILTVNQKLSSNLSFGRDQQRPILAGEPNEVTHSCSEPDQTVLCVATTHARTMRGFRVQ